MAEICKVMGCGRKYESKGFCKSHAQRVRSGRPVYCECGTPIPLMRGAHLSECLDCHNARSCMECDRPVFQKKYCQTHYMRWYRGRLVKPVCIRCGKPTGKTLHCKKYCNGCLPTRLKELRAQRQARERSVIYLKYERLDIYNLDKGVCYLCQEVVIYEQAHLDHVIPISLGGHDAEYNVAMVHSECNHKKHATRVENLVGKFPVMKIPERIRL